MKNLLVLLLSPFLLITSCKKDDDTKQPEPTQVGANIIFLKVNGVSRTYTGKKPPGMPPVSSGDIVISVKAFPNIIAISASSSEYNDGVRLYVVVDTAQNNVPILNTGYKIQSTSQGFASYSKNMSISSIEYLVDSNTSTAIFTRFDTDIVSGTFDFYGINRNDSNDRVHVTEGFFDISLK